MKFTWEEKDVKPGQRVGVPGTEERFIIGYIASGESKKNRCMTSLSDGMVFMSDRTDEGMAEVLNAGSYAPEEMMSK